MKLKEINHETIKWFHGINTKKEIIKWINNRPEQWTFEETIDWLYEYNKKRLYSKNNNEYIFIIINDKNEKVGYTQIINHDTINNKAELGVVIDPNYQNKGYGERAIREIIKLAQSQLKIHKLFVKIREDNEDSLKFFEKIGFTKESLLKDEIYQDNKYWNFYLLILINKRKESKSKNNKKG